MADRGRGRGRGCGRGRGANFRDGRGKSNAWAPATTNDFDDDTNGEYNAHLTERIRNGRDAYYQNQNGRQNRQTLALNPAVAKYVSDQAAIQADADPDDWLAVPEIPPTSEILIPDGSAVSLPRNKIDSPWNKPEKYLKAHFKLLREDTVSPLREAVAKFRKDPSRMDDNDTRIYEQVRIVGLTFTYKGICSRIRFSLARATRGIKWSSSKRLTSGTLVALTPTKDAFQDKCILALVAARPLENLELDVPEIDILFGQSAWHEVDPQETYIMIEASQGYFEAYRHTMRALQKQSQELFPLSEHICQLQQDVGPPQYLVDDPIRDITPAADDTNEEQFRQVDLLREWPQSAGKALDPTQWSAMRDILTNRLAVIQGPPGTGKTHVSKIAIDILLRNRKVGDPPIIVACQTNHALDQLLTFISKYEPDFIRLGGRSSDPNIKKRALHAMRKEQVYDDPLGSCYSKARRAHQTHTLKLRSLLSPVRGDVAGPLTAETLFHLGVITQQQRSSIEKGAADWISTEQTSDEPLQMWLRNAVGPFLPKYNEDSFGFQEAEDDLEQEQLKEFEAELGIQDEEDFEMLKGDYMSLNMGLTMQQPTPQTFEQAKKLLDTQTDLMRISAHMRGPMYLVMQEKALVVVRQRLREEAKEFDRICTQIQVGRWEKDAAYLAQAPIIGMTTTGLSKYRGLVSALSPKIILIEEAAEVLEAPVGVACVESLEHLILVGDHQQLQANCSVKELAGEPYCLNISMFERLVRNQLPHKTLLRQRRMQPEFRHLIQPIYPELKDDGSVATREQTEWGTGSIYSWFLNHDYQENQDETMSTYNAHEAELVAKFYRHLIRNRVPPAAITILTFYNGQRKKILRALKDDPETSSHYNKVKTVDSYQGEENHIVLLSLVRNNPSGKIGFLDINNRIVVALSRAKYGFYLFGNGTFLAEHNEVWSYVEDELYKQGRSRDKMPLTCRNHGRTVWVKYPSDFDRLSGGCDQPCGGDLPCGHKCPLLCHVFTHEKWITCLVPCKKDLVCGHFCMKKCQEECDCNCEVFQREKEATEAQKPDTTPQWKSLAAGTLTEDNLAKMNGSTEDTPVQFSEPAHDRIRAVADAAANAEPKETKLSNGRMRFEQDWNSGQPAPVQTMSQLSVNSNGKQETRESVREGKKPERPLRQPRGPPVWGYDGAFDRQVESEDNENEAVEAETLLSWNNEPVQNESNGFDQWRDPEDIA